MSNPNLLQFAPHFVAFGCDLDFESKTATMSVAETPPQGQSIVRKALDEIAKYDDSRSYIDGIAPLLLAKTIDGEKNPLPLELRQRILEATGLLNRGLFVAQELILSLNNHAWHLSQEPFKCTYFGTECVNRGIEPDPMRKGRVSHKNPDEFHTLDAKGRIRREQLVTRGLREMYSKIPQSIITRSRTNESIDLDLRSFSKLPVDEQIEVLQRYKTVTSGARK